MKKQYIIFFLLLILIVSAFGCGKKKDKTPSIPLWSIDNDGYHRFYTKDVKYYEHFCFQCDDVIINDPMTYVETSVKKVSGAHNCGYGIIFCMQDKDNFYRLLIETNGYYNIYKLEDQEWYEIVDWTSSTYLEPGFNKLNKIKVEYNSESKNFTVYFNDKPEKTFMDSTFTGGMFGFIAYVGGKGEENFPRYPVDVRFKQHYPKADEPDSSLIMTNHIPSVSSSFKRK